MSSPPSSSVSPKDYNYSSQQKSFPSVIIDDSTGTRVSLNTFGELMSSVETTPQNHDNLTVASVDENISRDGYDLNKRTPVTLTKNMKGNLTKESGYSSANSPIDESESSAVSTSELDQQSATSLQSMKQPIKFWLNTNLSGYDTVDGGNYSWPVERRWQDKCELEQLDDGHRISALNSGSYMDIISEGNKNEHNGCQSASSNSAASLFIISDSNNLNNKCRASPKLTEINKTPEASSHRSNPMKESSEPTLSSPKGVMGPTLSSAKGGLGPIHVRIQVPSGTMSSYVVATKCFDNPHQYEALVKPHPVYPINACSVQVKLHIIIYIQIYYKSDH